MTGTAAMLGLYDNIVHNSTPPSHDVTIDVSMVRYAYIAIGSPMFLSAFAFLCVHLKRRRTPAYFSNGTGVELSVDHEEAGGSVKVKNFTKNEKMEKLPFISKMDKIVLVSLVVSFYVFYACLEIIPRGFLTTFTAKYLGWSTRKSTLINSIYSVCLFAGRLVGIPLSALLRPRSILAVNLLVILASSLFMLLAEWRDGLLVWPAAGLLGYGVSTTFGSMILWFSESMSASGALVALFMIATSVGGMLGPPIVGQLFDRYSPMWMVYIILFVAIMDFIIYLLLIIMERRRKQPIVDCNYNSQYSVPPNGT